MAALIDTATAFRAGAGTLAVAAMTLTALAFWPVPVQLFELWMDSDRPYSHGLLVGPIAIWLSGRACLAARFEPVAPSVGALALFAGAALLWVIGYSIDVLTVQQVLFPALLVLAVATVAGWRMARRLLFPVGFLYFAIPFWTGLTPALQAITVAVVGFVLNAFGIPLFVEGNFITIPAGVFEIADGCAGLHFFVVALTLASLLGYLNLDTPRARLLLVAVAVALALVTNWVRVGSLVAVGHLSKMQHYLIQNDHYYYGWVLFALALIPLFMFARWQVRMTSLREPVPPARCEPDSPQISRYRRPLVYGLFVTVLAAPVVIAGRGEGVDRPRFAIELPAGFEGWQRTGVGDWSPSYVGADADALEGYNRDQEHVDVYIAIYRSQAQGKELVGNQNRLHGEGWRQRPAVAAAVQGLQGLGEVQERVLISQEGRGRAVWLWYSFGGRLVASDWLAKLWQAFGSASGWDPGAVIAISTECADDCSEARARLQEFVRGMGRPLSLMAARYQSDTGS